MKRILLIQCIIYFISWQCSALGTSIATNENVYQSVHPGILYHDATNDSVNSALHRADTVAAGASFLAAQDSLNKLATGIILPLDDAERDVNNAAFKAYLQTVLEQSGSMSFAFDSLKTVSIVSAPDSSFRIITWYVPYTNHRFRYHGFFQSTNKLLPLIDNTESIAEEQQAVLTAENWYGAYYYELIHNKYNDQDLYTLLGWKGHNPESRKRVIESLMMFDGSPVFGAQVFMPESSNPFRRIVFEYSAMASMSLVYEPIYTGQGQTPIPLIIFDRLAPIDERFWGQYKYYAPEGNIFDALSFRNDGWYLIEDVDARQAPQAPIPD